MHNRLFGTDGIRGKANEWPITPEVAMRIGRAVARALGEAKSKNATNICDAVNATIAC